MSGLLKTQVQLGDSATATQNFVLSSAAQDGTMKLSRGNYGATTQDVMVVDATGRVTFPVNTVSMVRLNTANGYGTTNIKIRRFLNIVTNSGTDISYTDSATLGSLFTINTNGIYSIHYDDQFDINAWVGISLNTTTPTIQVQNIASSELLTTASTAAASYGASCSTTVYLPAGSLIRAHTSGNGSGGNTWACHFTIIRVA